MKSIRRLTLALLLVVCGFVIGLVLTGRLRSADVAVADPPPVTQAPVAPVQTPAPLPPSPVAAPAGVLPDFTGVAERTVQAVTNISSRQVVQRSNSPFANDPFFQHFFGNQGDLFGSRRGVQSSLGSGVVVSADGYVLTNNHVVAGESGQISLRQLPEITVGFADNREMRAEIVGVDPSTDLALLKVDAGGLATVPWGDSSRLRVAEWVLAIGNPFQLNQTVTLGIVSAVGRRVGISAYEDFIQTDAAINPGNSGGALVNAQGELVGVNTAIFSQSGGYQGIGFAVPSNLARQVIDDFLKYGEVRRGSIGYLELVPTTPRIADQVGSPDARGLLVNRLSRNSPAAAAGITPGDIIVAFNGEAVTDPSKLLRLIQDAEIGGIATVRVVREGREGDVQVPVQSTSSRQQ